MLSKSMLCCTVTVFSHIRLEQQLLPVHSLFPSTCDLCVRLHTHRQTGQRDVVDTKSAEDENIVEKSTVQQNWNDNYEMVKRYFAALDSYFTHFAENEEFV